MDGTAFIITALGLTLVCVILMYGTQDPPLLAQLKQRYEVLLKVLREDPDLDPRWEPLKKPVILTAMNGWSKSKGAIAYNVNKGYEIYVCMDNIGPRALNTAMHVLIHELSHSTVREYEHSDNFWKNFKDLKEYCARHDLYKFGYVGPYCGENIRP